MIIVVPSCLKDADGARTRSDQNHRMAVEDRDDAIFNTLSPAQSNGFSRTDHPLLMTGPML